MYDQTVIDYDYVRQSDTLMKAVVVESYGGPLKWKDVIRPELPDADSELIKMM